MFPYAWPGVGLLLLRMTVAAGVVLLWRESPVFAVLHAALAWLVALFLLAGAVTPLACLLCCLLSITVLSRIGWSASSTPALMTGLCAAALALLGPGAYSLDAYLFGRRVVKLPGRHG
ncbi:hypothetical protein [Lysobacter sp.]|uniref:hypothetical protein n=1 Tax=Lysobacter sp. TaxID=72226 RepID=UPI002D54A776|nr:hypothetical protein [Lysobacter sp.]HZX77768.1 hypothetical protein [Lysobacter sp.]